MFPRVWIFCFGVVAACGFAGEPPIPAADRARMIAEFNLHVTALSAAIAESPRDVALLSRRGDRFLFLGQFAAAVADFEKMIALDPSTDAPHWRLGIAYHFTGQFSQSSRQFEKYHAYDGGDRENGIWKFFADVKLLGLEPARRAMLVYRRFDREPFPTLYEMFAGAKTTDTFLADLKARQLADDPRVMFFANYYAGLNEEMQGHRERALALLHAAVSNQWGQTAEGGPAYMWQVARLHYERLAATAPAPTSSVRLRVSDNRRFLQRTDGRPFFWLADTCWELFHRCNREDATLLLEDRARKGFTVIQAVALAEEDGLNVPNPYGHRPLDDNDPAKPNGDYFAHVDWVITKANSLGLVVALLPTWGDKYNRGRGKGPEIFTPDNARAYGEWLARRYSQADVVWVLGGDRALTEENHRLVNRALAEGIRAAVGATQLITFHPPGGKSSSSFVQTEPWLDFNMIQSGHRRDRDNYEMITHDYQLTPRRPVVEGEPGYEDHPNFFNPNRGWLDEHDVRKSCYWALFAGALGYTYGCHDIWQFCTPGKGWVKSWARTPWREALKFPGSTQVGHARRLMESRPFLTRVPDQSFLGGDAFGGTGDHLRATRDEAGSFAMVYVPSAQHVKVKLAALSGETIRAWWFNPRDGAATRIGEFPKTAEMEFKPPYDRAGRDWVLVLDDAAKAYPAPGAVR